MPGLFRRVCLWFIHLFLSVKSQNWIWQLHFGISMLRAEFDTRQNRKLVKLHISKYAAQMKILHCLNCFGCCGINISILIKDKLGAQSLENVAEPHYVGVLNWGRDHGKSLFYTISGNWVRSPLWCYYQMFVEWTLALMIKILKDFSHTPTLCWHSTCNQWSCLWFPKSSFDVCKCFHIHTRVIPLHLSF